ncbi:ribosomal protection-like ABC-F family protein [Streptomyces sp. NPDC090025]|uniref:ribosomal protection-like ABC-F family protein n=1 Tax=Streptomyces sp. NPDC090025 TaxID=3365922 RepID=UPI003837DE6C
MRDRAQLTLHHVSRTYGTRRVLDDVSFSVRPGERAAVVGENGSGKSTLLRLIAGTEAPDAGEVTVRFPGSVARLAQTLGETYDVGPGHTVQDTVDAALAGLRTLEARLREAERGLGEATDEQLAAYGELLDRFQERGGYEADAGVAAALHGLGLGHIGPERRVGTLSGGEQSRLALACVLASGAELLLLDEPTNHLDRAAVRWLQERLRAHRGTVVVVTHDRAFLEATATVILEVDRDTRTVTRYGDGWAGYRTARAAARRRQAQEHQEWCDEVARTEDLVAAAGQRLAATGRDPRQGFGKHRRSSENKLSGQVRAARVRLTELRERPVAAPPEPLRFLARFDGPFDGPDGSDSATGAGHGPRVTLSGVTVGDRLALDTLDLGPGDRLLVSGPNGAGKSTLLKVLAGELAPDGGEVRLPERIGHLAQELPATAPAAPLLTAYAQGRPGLPEEHRAELLGLGLFRAEDLHVPVRSLSVGQRRRLELARLVTRPVDLLVLDEPTNHLALALVEELEAALAGFPGAVVAVSHDPSFQAAFGGDRLELRAGRAVSATAAR